MAAAGVSIGRLQRWLEPWLSRMRPGVRPVHQALLRAVLLGLLRLPSSYVSEVARGLGKEFGGSLSAREHRLLRFLQSPKLRPERLKAAYHRLLWSDPGLADTYGLSALASSSADLSYSSGDL